MATEMTFGLLGPLAVSHLGKAIHVTAGRQRAVLAAFLLSPGRVLGCDDLAEVLWGAEPPPSARVAVQNYVMRLRRVLGDNGARICTWPGGYAIEVAPGEVDLYRAEELLAAARAAAAAGAWELAAGQAGQALALWRGEPLADVPSETLSLREGPRLAEFRLQALELRIDADLHLGEHIQVIGELRQLARVHPLRERLHELLVLALHRDGRRGEALAAYQEARRVLVEELGAEPREELRELQRQVLAADPAPAGAASSTAGRAAPAVPRQLPAAVPHFIGREPELAGLSGWLGAAGTEGPGVVVVCAIDGAAGVGKTALAVHWGHQVAGRFPDGQLYVNLRGYDPDQPMPAADALAGFLGALGVPGQEIPAELADRAARFRSMLAGRQVLVVLDNARDVAQVRPLLPASAGCAVLVTSRDALAGLVARDGATRLELDLLPLADATGLLRRLIGQRVEGEPEATAALAIQCCRLPLALRVAAELVTARPAEPIGGLAAELASQQRLDLLDAGGDARTAVREVFSWSCRNLDASAARAFRLAGLHPGPDLDRFAFAALNGASAADPDRLLGTLARAHLLQRTGPGRYGMHDLLRDYAAEQAAAQDGPAGCQTALTGLFDYYLHAAVTAAGTLYPAERRGLPATSGPATALPRLDDPASARAWLDTERAVITAIAARTASDGLAGYATGLSRALFRYLDSGGHFAAAMAIHADARRAASHAHDRAEEAAALSNLGVVNWRQGRYPQAAACIRQALELWRQAGDRAGEAAALNRLGLVDFQQGHYDQAAESHRSALALCRETGDRAGEARALGNLGGIDWRRGRYQEAATYLQQALDLHREGGDRAGEAEATGILGVIALRQGRHQQSVELFERALAVCREAGDRIGEADALTYLGVASVRAGGDTGQAAQLVRQALDMCRQAGDRPSEAYALASLGEVMMELGGEQAAPHFRCALELCRQTGDRAGEAQARNGLGEALLAAGHPSRAHDQHTAALTVASQIGDTYQQARAHHGLGRIARYTGDPGGIRPHWRQAITLYSGLGAPEADELRAALADPSAGDTGGGAAHARPV
jgi:DNA-binding SARP family transcriptional activator/Tfp pilus assembly protein PilF